MPRIVSMMMKVLPASSQCSSAPGPADVEIEIARRHDQALQALQHAAPPGANVCHEQLRNLVERLANRSDS